MMGLDLTGLGATAGDEVLCAGFAGELAAAAAAVAVAVVLAVAVAGFVSAAGVEE